MFEKKRGGQPGNKNSRKHGFYSKTLDKQKKSEFRRASKVVGLDEEITLLRINIKSLMDKDPPDLKLVDREARTLAVLISIKDNLRHDPGLDMKQSVKDVFSDLSERIADLQVQRAAAINNSVNNVIRPD